MKKIINISQFIIYCYLLLPVLIFFIGWLKWYSIILAALLIVAMVIALRNQQELDTLNHTIENKSILFYAFMIIVVWVLLSGIGGCSYQNSDHDVRTGMFRMLVEHSWPVKSVNGSRGLIYYIGFWLPAACVGKVFGFEAGYKFQIVWSVLGIFIVYYLICIWRRKVDLLPMLFMIFFSGLDILGMWFLGEEIQPLSQAAHIEWWAGSFQYSSMTTQLFWVFNQAIPAWIVTMLILVQKNNKNVFLVLGSLLLTSTFPFVGLIPFAVYKIVKSFMKDKSTWKEIFTFQNIFGVSIIGGVSFLYLIGNLSGGTIESESTNLSVYEPVAQLVRYITFYLFEFGIYAIIIFRHNIRNSLFYFTIAMLMICPLIKVGAGYDFCMRASIPALFIFMLLCMESWEQYHKSADRKKYILFTIFLIIGAITPFNEIHRSISNTYWDATYGQSVLYPESDGEEGILTQPNFSGECNDNIFYQYLAK